jgi:hypothetical protein
MENKLFDKINFSIFSRKFLENNLLQIKKINFKNVISRNYEDDKNGK